MEDNSVNSNSRIGMIKEIKFWSGNDAELCDNYYVTYSVFFCDANTTYVTNML